MATSTQLYPISPSIRLDYFGKCGDAQGRSRVGDSPPSWPITLPPTAFGAFLFFWVLRFVSCFVVIDISIDLS